MGIEYSLIIKLSPLIFTFKSANIIMSPVAPHLNVLLMPVPKLPMLSIALPSPPVIFPVSPLPFNPKPLLILLTLSLPLVVSPLI